MYKVHSPWLKFLNISYILDILEPFNINVPLYLESNPAHISYVETTRLQFSANYRSLQARTLIGKYGRLGLLETTRYSYRLHLKHRSSLCAVDTTHRTTLGGCMNGSLMIWSDVMVPLIFFIKYTYRTKRYILWTRCLIVSMSLSLSSCM